MTTSPDPRSPVVFDLSVVHDRAAELVGCARLLWRADKPPHRPAARNAGTPNRSGSRSRPAPPRR
ncbi:hypothetical protein K7G98_14420 [Saccharothrix sp. MB29]|nr:hypothetical protein [Saccharothrix sp. MB29]